MNSTYFTLRLIGVLRTEEDLLVTQALTSGAQGFSEVLEFIQEDVRYNPEVINKPRFDMDIYFESAPDLNTVEALSLKSRCYRYEVLEEENRDWREEWKKGLKPFQLSGDYWVVPSWLEAPKEAGRVLSIDPGMAFGTGTHETTRLISALLLKHLPQSKNWTGIDVGSGTGILAMIMSLEGASAVMATEIDPMACETGNENLRKNGIKNSEMHCVDLAKVKGEFDLVVANIIDGVLLDLQQDLKRLTKPGGKIILSGVLEEREKPFRSAFEDQNLMFLERTQLNEWVGLVYQKKES